MEYLESVTGSTTSPKWTRLHTLNELLVALLTSWRIWDMKRALPSIYKRR